MTQSPGHQKWPDHKVEEQQISRRVFVEVAGERVADTSRAIKVEEDKHPARFYIPADDVNMAMLSSSNKTSTCPFKGEARYYNLNLDVKQLEDVAWAYPTPYDEHSVLKDHIAFHDEMLGVDIQQVH